MLDEKTRIPADIVRIITRFVCGDYKEINGYWCRINGRLRRVPIYECLIEVI